MIPKGLPRVRAVGVAGEGGPIPDPAPKPGREALEAEALATRTPRLANGSHPSGAMPLQRSGSVQPSDGGRSPTERRARASIERWTTPAAPREAGNVGRAVGVGRSVRKPRSLEVVEILVFGGVQSDSVESQRGGDDAGRTFKRRPGDRCEGESDQGEKSIGHG